MGRRNSQLTKLSLRPLPFSFSGRPSEGPNNCEGKLMKWKQKAKITIDVFMATLLVALMAYPVTGQVVHEWAGAGGGSCSFSPTIF